MKRFVLFIFVLSMFVSTSVFGAELTGLEIMKEQRVRHEAVREFEQIKMVLIDSSNNKETRDMTRYAKKDRTGLFKYLARFGSPADIKGTALLTWEQAGKEDDQWLYLPALGQKLKRIASGGKKNYFMGTDFAYEDLRREKFEDHSYNVIKKEKFNDKDCYVIEALPATEEEKRNSGYSRRIFWITTDTFVTLKVDFYDHSKKLMKTQNSYDIKSIKGKMMRADKVVMTHHQNNHKTIMGLAKRKIDENIDDSIFTERYIYSAD